MLGVELVVVVIAELLSQEWKVHVADDDASAFPQRCHHRFLGIYAAGILYGLVVIAESAHHHAVQTVVVLDVDVEVADEVAGEVVLSQLEE